MADLLAAHQGAVQRLAEVPGLGVDSAQQIIAEVGATAATFPSSKHLASWMGACRGNEESAGVNYSHRCPKGNRQMRRVLNQAANAAVKAKGTIFAIVYRRIVPRLGHAQAIGAITHPTMSLQLFAAAAVIPSTAGRLSAEQRRYRSPEIMNRSESWRV
jgi:transposase